MVVWLSRSGGLLCFIFFNSLLKIPQRQSFFHIDCFKCAKCRDRVTADTNLLLLSDGQPVCSNCSYSCSVCNQPILDEAIMTGDDSYHAHCFKCRSCHNRIDELMFAKTSHGIYCMKCHHQRVARSRRHAQKQKERENVAPAASSSTSQSHTAKPQLGPLAVCCSFLSLPQAFRSLTLIPQNSPTGLLTPDSSGNSHSASSPSSPQPSPGLPRSATSAGSGGSYRSQPQTPQGGRQSAHLNGDARRSAPHPSSAPVQTPHRISRTTLPSPTSPSAISPQADSNTPRMYSSDPASPAIVLPPEVTEAGPQVSLSYFQHEPSSDSGSTTPFLTPDASTSLERRKSYDDGTRPLNVLFKNGAPPNLSLSVSQPNSRAGKRNSINPGTTFNYEAMAADINSKSISAPQSPLSFLPLAPNSAQTPSPGDVQRLPPPPRRQAPEVSRRPSRKGHEEVSASAPPAGGPMLRRSRSRTEGLSKPATGIEPTPRHNMMLEHLPPRSHSLTASNQDPELLNRRPSSTPSTNGNSRAPRRSTSDGKDRSKPSSSLSIDVEKSRTGNGVGNNRPMSPAYKAASPSHKVDVPHGVESGTDTSDGEREPSTKGRTRTSPILSKDKDAKSRRRPVQLELDTKQSASQEEPGETSFLSSAGDADSEDESSPVERVSRATFIAPAHPPIRFSVNGNGFQELLSQVDPRNRSSLYAIEQLVKMSQDAEAYLGAGQTAGSLNLNGSATQEGRHSPTPASAVTPTTTTGSSSTADNSSVTTISAPSGQGHNDSSMLDQPETAKGAESELRLHRRGMNNVLLPSSSRSSSDRSRNSSAKDYQRTSVDSNAAVYHSSASLLEPSPNLTITAPDASVTRLAKLDPSYAVTKRLQDALQDAVRRGMTQVTLDQEFLQTVTMMIDQRRDENSVMKGRLDHTKVRALFLGYSNYLVDWSC
jgi:Rho-type GTPase-activating protein 1/2